MKIGVTGIGGRMGRLVADEIERAGSEATGREDWASSDVLVDFTHPDRLIEHATLLTDAGVPWVLGTTGLSDAQQAVVHEASHSIAIVQAANFSPGVTLVLEAARRLARALPSDTYDAEILEMHHRQKIDAPSGTALALGRAVAAGRGEPMRERPAAGARPDGAIGFASMRGGQVVGEHMLLFAGETEHIFIGHKALDRRMFARGAVQAAFWVIGRPPGLYGMAHVLGISESEEKR
jgi:4-hydroxy-tetrahydrodipicolinate reductase